MKTVALMIGAVILMLLMPAAITSIDDFRMTDQEDQFITTTGAADTDSDVTLSQTLFGDETRNATVSSNVTADAPIASSYVSATKVLTVIGLEASESHRLTVTYKIDALTDYYGAGTGARVWPLMLILGVLGIIAGAVYNATRRGD